MSLDLRKPPPAKPFRALRAGKGRNPKRVKNEVKNESKRVIFDSFRALFGLFGPLGPEGPGDFF